MNRRIVAGVVLVAALLPGCFLFGAEETEKKAPVQDWGGSGGGGGEGGVGGLPPASDPGFLVTNGREAVELPFDGPFAAARVPERTTPGMVTLELWVRPTPGEGGTACAVAPRPGCEAPAPEKSVCGPIARLEYADGHAAAELRLEGRCLVTSLAPDAKVPVNLSRFRVPEGAWTHVALIGSEEGQGTWEVTESVNFVKGGGEAWGGPFGYGGLKLVLGGESDGPGRLAASFDEVRIWAAKQGESELRSDSDVEPLPRGLASRWSFDDLANGTATTLRDRGNPEQQRDAAGLDLRPGGIIRSFPPAVDGCLPPQGGRRLDEDGSLLACGRARGATEEGLDAVTQLCAPGFHHCRLDDPALLAFLARPEGAEDAPGCYVLAATRASGHRDEFERTQTSRACVAGCPLPLTGNDTDPVDEPERLAIGVGCEVDRPGPVGEGCPAVGLPAIRADDTSGINDCAQRDLVVDGVACCRN